MASPPSYECDTEFFKLMMHRSDVDLTMLALELARDAYPHLDFEPTLEWINARADELARPVTKARTELDALRELSRCLSETFGIYGDAQSYARAESSYLNRVIETRRGIPISLSLLYMAVAGRVGIDLRGVSAPMHFLTRYESVDGPVFIDPFARGRLMTPTECGQWLRRLTRLPARQIRSALKAAGPRTTVVRLLNNLKALYVEQELWSGAWIVQHRLTALQPASYEQRRDLAVISLRADRPGQALDLLQCCLRTAPEREQTLLNAHVVEAHRLLAMWN